MTMENDLVERLLEQTKLKWTVPSKITGDDYQMVGLDLIHAVALRIQALEAELATALIEVSNQARLRGEAEGKLHVSELAGIVEGWQIRAERAEAELGRKTEALLAIRELNMTGADENGHRWSNSDLIDQEIMAAISARSALEEKTDV